jgi:ribonuclease HII
MVDGPSLEQERVLHKQGYRAVAGLDEVGRGAWAGPLVACATILPLSSSTLVEDLAGIRDSKRLTPRRRVHFYERITQTASAVGVGVVGSRLLDQLGVVEATKLAMRRALSNLPSPPDYLLVDYFPLSYKDLPNMGIVGGDDLCYSIAAASIVAKVVRDGMMEALDGIYPGYVFGQHKGYGTPQHREALNRIGPCPIHRLSYAPMRLMIETNGQGRQAERPSDGRSNLGRLGEGVAAQYLEERGYVICEMNYRCAVGEIDIVALDGECLAFVEVRTRKSTMFGSPEESITSAKKEKLIEVAETYLQERQSRPLDWRIDVVAIQMSSRGVLRHLELIQNAIEE